MIRTFTVLLLLTLNVGCGIGMLTPSTYRDPAFLNILEAFHIASEANGRPTRGDDELSVVFVSLPLPTIGACIHRIVGSRQVVIDPAAWGQASPSRREALLFHELGHCLLVRVHVPGIITTGPLTGYPISLMYPEAVPGNIYEEYRDYYVHELFVPTAQPPKLNSTDSTQASLTGLGVSP